MILKGSVLKECFAGAELKGLIKKGSKISSAFWIGRSLKIKASI
jgi:hypothetical protein